MECGRSNICRRMRSVQEFRDVDVKMGAVSVNGVNMIDDETENRVEMKHVKKEF